MHDELSFGEWLKQRRKLLHLTQHDLARRVNCSLSTLEKIEADARRPSRQIAELLAQHLGIAADQRAAFVRFARSATRAVPPGAFAPPPAPAPWRTQLRHCTNLPAQSTPLIGRDDDLVRAQNLLLSRNLRLLTLTGPAGVGKTRLAIAVAQTLLYEFNDGIYFVELAPLREPALVAAAIAQTLALKETGTRSFFEQLVCHLRERRVLLVLDNFEQVITAAPFVADLLSECRWLKALATSRAPLQLRIERQFPVPPLALPNPARLLPCDALANIPAVHLFLDRAQAVNPAFSLDAGNAAAVANICARLDGLPLAIELVAAQSARLSPLQISARLLRERSLSINAQGPRDLPSRQRTLHHAIRWSCELLSPQAQWLFARLGIFVGGCTLEAVAQVEPEMSRSTLGATLTALERNSLLRSEMIASGETRWIMLETVREFALEELDARGERAAMDSAHAHCFLSLVERGGPEMLRAPTTPWLQWLAREHHNLRAALAWFSAHEPETGLRLGGALWGFWMRYGYYREGRHWLTTLLEHSPAKVSAARAQALRGAGVMAQFLHDYSAARALFQVALDIQRQLGDWREVAALLTGPGFVASLQGDLTSAQSFYQESLALYQTLQDQTGVAHASVGLGRVALKQGEYARAETLFETTLAIRRALGDGNGLAHVLGDLGDLAQSRGDLMRAAEYYREGVSVAQAYDSRAALAFALVGLGFVALAERDSRVAHERLTAGLAVFQEMDDALGVVLCLVGYASAWVTFGPAEECTRAVRVLGAVEMELERLGAMMWQPFAGEYARAKHALRVQLDTKTFDEAWRQGRAMNLEQASVYARASL